MLQVVGVEMWFKGWKLTKMHIWSLPVCLSPTSAIERMPHQSHIPHCPSHHHFTPRAMGILNGYVRSSTPSAIERTQVCTRAHCLRSRGILNGYMRSSTPSAIKRTQVCTRAHCLQSRAPLTWQHIKVFPINSPSCIFRKLTFWEAPLGPETLCSSLSSPSKRHFIL